MPEKKVILYLDDDEHWRKIITSGLSDYDLRAVGAAEEFERVLSDPTFKPDLFLVDWLLSRSGEVTAQPLLEKLLHTYPRIPRIVLTAGKGDEEAALRIAALKCDYVAKGELEPIKDAIRRSIDTVANTGAPEQQDSYYEKAALRAVAKQQAELTRENEELAKENQKLEQRKETLEKQNQAVQTQMEEAKEQVQGLVRRREELEKKNKQDQSFFERFLNVSKSIVDQRLSLRQVADRLLQLVLEYSDCSVGILISFDKRGGLLIDDDDKPRTLTAYLGKPISLSDVGDPDQLRALATENGSRIINNFKSDRLTDHTFVTTNLTGITKRNNLLLVPLGLNKVGGALLLFDKRKNTPFDDEDKQKIEQLPLSDILNAAQEMPFRSYDQHGFGKFLLNQVHNRPWEVKPKLLSTAIEFLQAIIYLISILVIVLPGYHIVKYVIDRWWHEIEVPTPHMVILGNIELLLMLLTFVLFSLGLVILFEPKYAQGLPRWMVRFTRLSTLEGTMLRLVVIILAVDVLGRFLASHKHGFTDTAPELFVVAISICLITIAVGVFLKYFLHESESSDDDG